MTRPGSAFALPRALVVALALASCTSPWQQAGSRTPPPSAEPSAIVVGTAATAADSTGPRAGASPIAAPTASQTPAPAATQTSPSPAASTSAQRSTPTAEPTSTPSVDREPAQPPVIAAACCGVFAWLDDQTLAAYDTPNRQPAGSWLIDRRDGSRRYLAPHVGLPGAGSLLAVSRPDAGQTDILRADGSVVGVIRNGGTMTWISPDGSRVAWLARLPGSTSSSLVSRPVRLWVAGIDGAGARAVRDLRASQLAWLPDNRTVLLLGRDLDGGAAGVWSIDVETAATTVVARAAFPQSLQLAPDGTRAVFLATLSSNPADDGLWLLDLPSGATRRLAESGPFRWSGDDSRLWLLRLGAGSSGDRLELVDVQSGAIQRRVTLAGQVRQDDWAVAPGGGAVAFWRDEDGAVVIQNLTG